jgi:hypothetical protein
VGKNILSVNPREAIRSTLICESFRDSKLEVPNWNLKFI